MSGAGGTGLGLDIARRTAEGAGGVFRTGRSAAGGARIAMEFPDHRPPAAPAALTVFRRLWRSSERRP